MSQRRMTSLEVTDTDAFLDMPVSSQLLYFHLNARADDDGFVSNPRKIVRMVGAQSDDIKLLIAKKFVIAFDDGLCVIKHWRINNFIRKDIYKETRYLNLKKTLFIRKNGAYTLNNDGNAVPVPLGHFQLENIDFSSVNEALTTRQPRLGKVRLENVVDKSTTLNSKKRNMDIVPIDEDGNPIKRRDNSNPRNKAAFRLQKKFQDMAQKEVGTRPLHDAVGYKRLCELLVEMKEDEIVDMFEDWFDSGRPDDESISIRKATSIHRVNTFRTT